MAVKSNVVPDATILNDFEDLLKIVRGTLDDIECKIVCPLLQIHAYCESDNQHEVTFQSTSMTTLTFRLKYYKIETYERKAINNFVLELT